LPGVMPHPTQAVRAADCELSARSPQCVHRTIFRTGRLVAPSMPVISSTLRARGAACAFPVVVPAHHLRPMREGPAFGKLNGSSRASLPVGSGSVP
jgi:hypothetical protein